MGRTARLRAVEPPRRAAKVWRWAVLLLVVVMAAAVPWVTDVFWRWRYPYRYRPLIEQSAAEFQLDPLLVAAVIREESRFNPDAHSGVGAVGLMQMMPETATWAAKRLKLAAPGSDDLVRPEVNIRLGCWYLRYLIRRNDGNLADALAAYNGGEGNVARWHHSGQGIPFPETRQFVARSLRTYERYRTLYAGDSQERPLVAPSK